MISADLEKKFNQWLDRALSEEPPEHVVAFCFNLYEPWAVEVVGTNEFRKTDAEWRTAECFRPAVDLFDLPETENWRESEAVLEAVKGLVQRYVKRLSAGSTALVKSEAVAVGFVDGDLRIVWRAQQAGTN